jgi:hypothetical protein
VAIVPQGVLFVRTDQGGQGPQEVNKATRAERLREEVTARHPA